MGETAEIVEQDYQRMISMCQLRAVWEMRQSFAHNCSHTQLHSAKFKHTRTAVECSSLSQAGQRLQEKE